MDWTIRPAVPADEAGIRELFEEMLRSIGRPEPVEGYAKGYLDKFWLGGGDRIFVAEEEAVVGFLSAEVCREPEAYVYLDDFSVTEAYRSRGIGTALLRRAEAYAVELGIPAVLLHVEKTNVPARRLYERSGFSVYRDDGQRYLMHKRVNADSGKRRIHAASASLPQ